MVKILKYFENYIAFIKYKFVKYIILTVNWTPPSGWTGCTPALYYSFDTTNELNLMAGMQQSNISPLVSGKVKYIRCVVNLK